MWGKIKKKKIQLRFIDSIRFMAGSVDSLSRNLVEMNEITCNECGSQAELTHILTKTMLLMQIAQIAELIAIVSQRSIQFSIIQEPVIYGQTVPTVA